MKSKSLYLTSCLLAVSLMAGCASSPAAQPQETPEPTPTSTAEPTAAPTEEPEAESTDWLVAPQYDFDEMVPLYTRWESTAGYDTAAGFYAVRRGDRWSIFAADAGKVLMEDQILDEPYLYDSVTLSAYLAEEKDTPYSVDAYEAIEAPYKAEMQDVGADFDFMSIASGGYGHEWIYTDDGKIYDSYSGNYEFDGTLLADVEDPPALFGIRQAFWDAEAMNYLVDSDALYAISDSDGNFLSEFQYKNVCMLGQDLIAVQDQSGNWGYCDKSGTPVIPCEYQAMIHCGYAPEAFDCPLPDMSGVVVVMDADGNKQVLYTDGSVCLETGTYEDFAPSLNGGVWAKQNGLWGLLKLNETA